jgi:thiosulfate dehydrogenase [quinone] large subunit
MTPTISITRSTTVVLAVAAATLFLVLCGAFGADMLAGPLWNSAHWLNSPAITYLLTALILTAGFAQVRRLAPAQANRRVSYGEAALLMLPVRLFVGRVWLSAGLDKLANPAWSTSGQPLHGFWQSAIAVDPNGKGKITYAWYRDLLWFMDDHHWSVWFAKLIVGSELLVGLALLFGSVVGLAALGGVFLNLNYGLAGAAGANPILLLLGLLLAVGWRTAGYWGLDRWLLPRVGAADHHDQHLFTGPSVRNRDRRAEPARRLRAGNRALHQPGIGG